MCENTAYETHTDLLKNPAYEETSLHMGDQQQVKIDPPTPEPDYEIIPQRQTASRPAKEDEYDRLNRAPPNIN